MSKIQNDDRSICDITYIGCVLIFIASTEKYSTLYIYSACIIDFQYWQWISERSYYNQYSYLVFLFYYRNCVKLHCLIIRNVIEIMYCITLLLLLLLLKNELKNDYFRMISIKLRLTWSSLYHFVNRIIR